MLQPPAIRHQRHGIQSKTLSVSVPGDVADEARALASRRRISLSRLVSEALSLYLTLKRDVEREEVA